MNQNQTQVMLNVLLGIYWNMDYREFLSRTGFNEDQWSLDKFSMLQQGASALCQFDVETLAKIVATVDEQPT